MKKIILILALLPNLAFANLTKQELLEIAYQAGKRIEYSNTLQAMLLQESNAGDLGRIHDKGTTFGVMCIKVSTAKQMLAKCKKCHKYNNIKQMLINDDNFNIRIAVEYLKYLLNLFNDEIDLAILAYNVGLGNVRKYGIRYDPNNYIKKVKSKMKSFNRYFLLTNQYKYDIIV